VQVEYHKPGEMFLVNNPNHEGKAPAKQTRKSAPEYWWVFNIVQVRILLGVKIVVQQSSFHRSSVFTTLNISNLVIKTIFNYERHPPMLMQ
jgi:hypothetical protein